MKWRPAQSYFTLSNRNTITMVSKRLTRGGRQRKDFPPPPSPSLGSKKSLEILRLANENREKKETGGKQYHQI